MGKQINIPELRFPEFDERWDEGTLGKAATFSKGKGISKADITENGKTECIRYGELYTTYRETISEVVSRTNVHKKELVLSDANDVIIPASGETQIDIATASCVLKSGIALGGDLNIIKTANNGVFLSYYLNSKKKIEIAKLAQGISVVHLYSTQLSQLGLLLPKISEQTKIASFFSSVDEKIQSIKKKKNLLREYKKGMMQQLFSQELRFKNDSGEDFPNWELKKLSYYLTVSNKKNSKLKYGKEDVLSVSGEYGIVNQIEFQGRSFAGESVHNYGIVECGDIVYTKSPLKANPFGIIKVNNGCAGIVSTLYAVYKVKLNEADGAFLDYYFQLNDNTNSYLRPLVKKGARNDMNINNEYVLSDNVLFPKKDEQIKIANFLTSIDQKIELVKKQLKDMEQWKKGLLQKMFC